MKKLLIPAFAFWLSCLFPSCTSTSPNHFLKEADYRNKVEADFGQKKEILNRGNLFDIFNDCVMNDVTTTKFVTHKNPFLKYIFI